MIESVSHYIPELEGRMTWQRLTCDWCGSTYPESGEMEEAAAIEAHVYYGWDTLDSDDICPPCQVQRLILYFEEGYFDD